jgi:hypothetical protein
VGQEIVGNLTLAFRKTGEVFFQPENDILFDLQSPPFTQEGSSFSKLYGKVFSLSTEQS